MPNIYYHDPAATGTNDGSSWTNAYVSPHSAFSGMISGDITYARGTYTLVVPLTTVNNGTTIQPIKFVGCDANGVANSGQYTLIGTNVTNCFNHSHSYIFMENVNFQSAKSHGTTRSAGTNMVYRHCSFTSNALNGSNTASAAIYIDCVFRSNSGTGATAPGTFINCVFAGNSSYGVLASTTPMLLNCLAYDNGDDNFRINSPSAYLYHSTAAFSNSGSAAWINGSGQTFIQYNALTNCPGYGIENCNTVANIGIIENYNGFYNNTSGNLQNITAGLESITFSASPYIDTTTDNYSTNDTAEKRRLAINLEWV